MATVDSPLRSACSAIALALLVSLSQTACAMDSNQFDKAAWITEGAKDIRENERWRQTESFLKLATPGKTRIEILEKAGPPDETMLKNGLQIDLYDVGTTPYGIDAMTYNLEYKDGVLEQVYFTRY